MTIYYKTADRIATITIDRPPVNALDRNHQTRLTELAARATADPGVRAVLIYGARGHFSAGADIAEMAAMDEDEMRGYAPQMQQAWRAIASIPKPVCAAIEGYAHGGGLELALNADFRVVANDARLSLPEIKLGVIPNGGGTQTLTRLVGPARAKWLIMSGQDLTATAAKRLGLANEVVEPGKTLDAASALLAHFTHGPRYALAAAKAAIDSVYQDNGFATENREFADLFDTADQQEGMNAFLEERSPQFGAHTPTKGA